MYKRLLIVLAIAAGIVFVHQWIVIWMKADWERGGHMKFAEYRMQTMPWEIGFTIFGSVLIVLAISGFFALIHYIKHGTK